VSGPEPIELAREAIATALAVAAPVLATGLVVAILVGIGQALVQIQDQTLAAVPRLLAMAVTAALLLGWIAERILDFAAFCFAPT
jgi:flagellar biosynthetic protein FliQ